MNDLWYPVECTLCGVPIATDDELVVTSAAWEEEAGMPCHQSCVPGELPTRPI